MLKGTQLVGFGGRRSGASATYNGVANWSSTKYLTRTPGSTGSRRASTTSFWLKRSGTGSLEWIIANHLAGAGTIFWLGINASDQITIITAGAGTYVTSSSTYTSTTTWLHIVAAVDTDQATAANRAHIYVNGSEVSYSATDYHALNADIQMNTSSYANRVGAPNTSYCKGTVAHVHWIDGAQLTPSDFAQDGGLGKVPKAYAGSFGTNGYLLDFANTSDLGNDVSGNGNDLTVTGLTSGDASSQTVTYA